MTEPTFANRVVAITGGAGDIGLATARHLGRLGAFLVLRAFARHIAEHGGGSIVNMASMAATRGPPNMTAYTTSKAAVLGMTLTASKDLAPHGTPRRAGRSGAGGLGAWHGRS